MNDKKSKTWKLKISKGKIILLHSFLQNRVLIYFSGYKKYSKLQHILEIVQINIFSLKLFILLFIVFF